MQNGGEEMREKGWTLCGADSGCEGGGEGVTRADATNATKATQCSQASQPGDRRVSVAAARIQHLVHPVTDLHIALRSRLLHHNMHYTCARGPLIRGGHMGKRSTNGGRTHGQDVHEWGEDGS